MTIGFKVQVVIRYKDSPTVRCHSIHKVIMREYQFAELVSHIRLTASKIKIKNKKWKYYTKDRDDVSNSYDHSNVSSREQYQTNKTS